MAYEVIGIAGTSASGKNTAADHLTAQGFLHVDTGAIVQEECRRLFGTVEPHLYREAAHSLRQRLGAGALALTAIAEYQKSRDDYAGVVVSGIRATAPAEVIISNGGVLIYVDAPLEQRFDRLVARGRLGESKTLEDFRKFEEEEISGGLATGQNLGGVQDLSNVQIYNDSTLQVFLDSINQAVGLPRAI